MCLAGHVPRNIEAEYATNVASRVSYSVIAMARLRHDGGTPLSRSEVARTLVESPPLHNKQRESDGESMARDMLFEGVCRVLIADAIVLCSFNARKERVMKRLLVLPLVLFLAGTSSALAQDVRYNFAKDANFSSFKTYKWVPIKTAQPISDLVENQIKSTVDAELGKKGLTRTEADTADLYVGYQAAVSTEKQFTSFNDSWGYGGGWYGPGWYGGGGMSTTTGSTSTIYVGQLALDMYASGQKALVWRGTATKTLDTKAKPEKQQKNLTKAVAKLLKNYPPPVKK